jgi:hypothetical protein
MRTAGSLRSASATWDHYPPVSRSSTDGQALLSSRKSDLFRDDGHLTGAKKW